MVREYYKEGVPTHDLDREYSTQVRRPISPSRRKPKWSDKPLGKFGIRCRTTHGSRYYSTDIIRSRLRRSASTYDTRTESRSHDYSQYHSYGRSSVEPPSGYAPRNVDTFRSGGRDRERTNLDQKILRRDTKYKIRDLPNDGCDSRSMYSSDYRTSPSGHDTGDHGFDSSRSKYWVSSAGFTPSASTRTHYRHQHHHRLPSSRYREPEDTGRCGPSSGRRVSFTSAESKWPSRQTPSSDYRMKIVTPRGEERGRGSLSR